MSTATLHLRFVDGPTGPFTEDVQAKLVRRAAWELTSHSTFCPLAPGDIVIASPLTNVIERVKHLEPLYTIEATLHLPAGTRFGMRPDEEHPAMKAVAECEEDWRRAAWVTRNTAFSFLVSSQSTGWLEENVEAHPYVEHVELVRTPDLKPALEHWVRTPAFV